METEKYYISDIESGTPIPVTKEYHDKYCAMMQELRKPLDMTGFPPPKIVGTMGDFDSIGIEKIFYNPESFNHVPYPADVPIGYFTPRYEASYLNNNLNSIDNARDPTSGQETRELHPPPFEG